jgi:hypothetical protein
MKISKGKDFKYSKFTTESINYDNIKVSVCAQVLGGSKVKVHVSSFGIGVVS